MAGRYRGPGISLEGESCLLQDWKSIHVCPQGDCGLALAKRAYHPCFGNGVPAPSRNVTLNGDYDWLEDSIEVRSSMGCLLTGNRSSSCLGLF